MKRIFLLIVLAVLGLSTFAQVNKSEYPISADINYTTVFQKPGSWSRTHLGKEGGISLGGVPLYSHIAVDYANNTYKHYVADYGFGFCKITIDGEVSNGRYQTYESVVYEAANDYYGLVFSAGESLLLAKPTYGGDLDIMADLGKYNRILSVYYSGKLNIVAENTNNEIVKVTYSINYGALSPIDYNVSVTSITLDQTSITLENNSSVQLEAAVLPEIATNKEIEWTSSDTSIATVADGLVTGVNAGMAIISAKATDGSNVMAQCIAVVQETSGVASINIVDGVEGVYTSDGKQVSTMTFGTYVVRMADGTTKKIQVK